ncbi:alpha/beta hydrolase, partial [Streptomyces carpinensis]
LTELPGLGHMTPMEAPDQITAKIRELVTAHIHARTNDNQHDDAARIGEGT